MTYPNEALTALAERLVELIDIHCLTAEEIAAICKDLPGEAQAHIDDANEAAWLEYYDAERLAARDEAYRRDMIAAGRGELLK